MFMKRKLLFRNTFQGITEKPDLNVKNVANVANHLVVSQT